METGTTRQEEDLLGALEIPAEVYWGIHTARAIRNFPLSGRPVRPGLIRALALVKKACAAANLELGYLPPAKGEAIIAASAEIAAGGLPEQFPVDALQGGAGTSTNMNVNEVIANRAIDLLGGQRGGYLLVHPLEEVNRSPRRRSGEHLRRQHLREGDARLGRPVRPRGHRPLGVELALHPPQRLRRLTPASSVRRRLPVRRGGVVAGRLMGADHGVVERRFGGSPEARRREHSEANVAAALESVERRR